MADSDDPTLWGPPSAPGVGAPLPYLPEPPKRRSPAGIVALLVGLLAIVGGALFAASQLAGDESSPEGAAQRLFDAIGNEDLLGVLEALPPGERDALRQPIEDLAGELERLEVLSGDLDLHDLSGIDLAFDDLTFSSAPLAEGLATVTLTGGKVRSRANPSELPLGDFVKDLAGDALRDAEPETQVDDAAGNDTIVTVKEDGRWYVSLWYTVAEAARKSAGEALPDFGQAIRASGAGSPEGAVEAFIRAAAGLELSRLVELLSPDEARALHDYAPLFLGQVEAALGDLDQDVDVDIAKLELRARPDGDRALVQVRSFEFDAVAGGGAFSVSYRDGCATIPGAPGEQQRFCPGDVQAGAAGLLGGLTGGQLPQLDIGRPELGFVAVRTDDAWYVSPTRTVLDNLTALLRVFDREDLDELAEFFGQFFLFGR